MFRKSIRILRKITETYYPDQGAVNDEICGHYLTISSPIEKHKGVAEDATSRPQCHRQSGSNDEAGQRRRRNAAQLGHREKNLNWPIEESLGA